MNILILLLTTIVIGGKLKLTYTKWKNNSSPFQYLIPDLIRKSIYPDEGDAWLEICTLTIMVILIVMLKNHLVLRVAPVRRFMVQNNLLI